MDGSGPKPRGKRMSLVAQQYNLMSEQLRRGIGEFNQGKLQEAALGLQSEKTQFEMGMARKGMELREAESNRADTRLKMEQEIQPSRVAAAKDQAKLAHMEAEKMSWEYRDMVNKRNTPLTQDNYLQTFGVDPRFAGDDFNKDALKIATEMAGVSFDPKTGQAMKDGKKLNQWDAERDPSIKAGWAFADWELFSKRLKDNILTAANNAPDHESKKILMKRAEQLDEKLKAIDSDRVGYERRRTDTMVRALGGIRDENARAGFQVALQVQLAREKAEAAKTAGGTWKTKTYTYSLPNGKIGEAEVPYNSQTGITPEYNSKLASAGLYPKEDALSMDKMKVATLQQFARGGYGSLAADQRVLYNDLTKEFGTNRMMRDLANSMAGELQSLTPEKYNEWYNKTERMFMYQNNDWRDVNEMAQFLTEQPPEKQDEVEKELRRQAKELGWSLK
jgi:hypothetical protein